MTHIRTAKSRLKGLFLASAVAATAGLPTLAVAGKADDTLNIAWAREQPSLDYYFQNSREGIIINRHVWDNLLYRDPNSGEFSGLLAKDYKVVDEKTFDFTLREGVKFHDGSDLTADDVVDTMAFLLKPDSTKLITQPLAWIDRVEKTGEMSVRFHAKETTPLALLYLAGEIPIYPSDYYAEVGPEGMGIKPVGTGPYMVTEVEPGKKIVFEKNPNYFADSPKGQPQIGKIVQRTIPDVNTQIIELASGKLDWIFKVPADQAERLGSLGQLDVQDAATMRVGYLTFDAVGKSGENPFQDARVRQAVAHAIDRDAIAENIVRGGAIVVHSACYPDQFGCTQDVTKYEYDPEKAKKLLAEAGYPDGFSTPVFGYRDRNYLEPMISYLAAVGIKTDLRYGKYAATRDAIRGGEVPMAFMTWGSGSVPDIDAITSYFFTGGADDTYGDADVKGWLEEGAATLDEAKRISAYNKALGKIADEAYWLPLFTYPTTYAMTKELGWTPTADEIPRFWTAGWK